MTSDFGRQLLQVVEIDVDQCTRVYGEAPCAAALGTTGVRKCYNTRFTCQDPDNYDKGVLTLRFARNQGGFPKGTTVYPALRNVSTRASTINLSGVDDSQGPLGSRAEVSVTLSDFTDADFDTDPYRAGRVDGTAQTDEGGYDPRTRGTFWSKFRARNPYLVGRPLRVLEGEVGQAFAAMRTRAYIITEMSGPDGDGTVTIRARDILDLADNEKALAPAPSTGVLLADMTEAASSFDLDGVGADYAAAGRVRIGSEIMRYTRSGETFTVVARGVDGSEASSHTAGDTVQQCLRFDGRPLYEIARDLLRDYAGVPEAYIPFSDWQAEGQRWQASYLLSATISEPTGVTKLLAELAIFGALWWWDETSQLIRFRANRFPNADEPLIPFTDDPSPALPTAGHIVRQSVEVDRPEDQRLSQVLFWHGLINAADSATNASNFSRLQVAIIPADANKYNQERSIELFTRWLCIAGNDSIARSVSTRLVNRYEDTPTIMEFRIDAKDADKALLGNLLEVRSQSTPDETGLPAPRTMQVSSVEEVVGGHSIQVRVESYGFSGRYGFITENSRPDYDASTASQLARGTYIVGSPAEFSDGTGPYRMF